jgi:urease accessory protein
MLMIDQIPAPISPGDLIEKEVDKVVLTWEQRRWTRGHLKTVKGRDLALALPTGSVLEPGALLCVEPEWCVFVEAAAEPVITISPRDHTTALRVAFEVGNRHFPLAIEGETLLVPDDTAMVQLLDRLGVAWERRSAAFSPVGKSHRHEH